MEEGAEFPEEGQDSEVDSGAGIEEAVASEGVGEEAEVVSEAEIEADSVVDAEVVVVSIVFVEPLWAPCHKAYKHKIAKRRKLSTKT